MSEPFTLRGSAVHLLPMGLDHAEPLLEAATADRSTFTYTPVPWDADSMRAYVEKAIARRDAAEQHPFVTWSVEQRRIVGATRFYDLGWWDWTALPPGSEPLQRAGRPDVASIGYTWLAPSAQRTPVNTEAKVLMLDHAFDQWKVHRVRIQTDARNRRSRSAIERLGCRLDGVLRADMPGADGTIRDSAVYSLLASEWPARRRRLTERLDE
ncbi:MAG: GNAT family N-acetyltransferase [Acidimicrobiales bacterium]